MSAIEMLTFESMEMTLSYKAHLTQETEVRALRVPQIKGLSPSPGYIDACAPLRSPMQLLQDARRDTSKFHAQAAEEKERSSSSEAVGSTEEKHAAIARVSRFLGATKDTAKGLGR